MTNAAAASLPPPESNGLEAVASCLAELGIIRERIKAADRGIQRVDASIRWNLEETRASLRPVPACR